MPLDPEPAALLSKRNGLGGLVPSCDPLLPREDPVEATWEIGSTNVCINKAKRWIFDVTMGSPGAAELMILVRLRSWKPNPKFERMLIYSSCLRLLRCVRNNAE